MSKARIFVSWPHYSAEDSDTGARLVSAGYDLLLFPKLGARGEDELLAMLGDSVGAIVSTDPFTRRVLESSNLRIIARVGVGTDSIDRQAATEQNIAISVTPGMNAETAADHTLALMLALVRRVVQQDASVKSGRWDRVGPGVTPVELPGKIVGIVGAGTIGRAVIRRLRGFDVSLIYYDPIADDVTGAERVATLDELLSRSDIVSLHVPLNQENAGIIDRRALSLMKPSAFLINTSRGQLLDQASLFSALREMSLGGAALDVFEAEPPGAVVDGVPNLICSAHIGGISIESIQRMTISATSSVLSVLSGGQPDTVINPVVFGGKGLQSRTTFVHERKMI